MFGRKDKGGVVAAARLPGRAKKASPRDLMIEQLSAVAVGKEITYKLGLMYAKPYVTVVRNSTGKRFVVYQDARDAAGDPAGKRTKFWDANEAKDIVSWILDREGALYRR